MVWELFLNSPKLNNIFSKHSGNNAYADYKMGTVLHVYKIPKDLGPVIVRRIRIPNALLTFFDFNWIK